MTANVVNDGFAGALRRVGPLRSVVARLAFPGAIDRARVEQERRAIGKDEQRRVAGPGVDLVDVEEPTLPGRQWLPSRRVGSGRLRRKQTDDSAPRDECSPAGG